MGSLCTEEIPQFVEATIGETLCCFTRYGVQRHVAEVSHPEQKRLCCELKSWRQQQVRRYLKVARRNYRKF